MDAGLTLEKAKQAIRQKEAVLEQQQELQGTKKHPIVVEENKHNKKMQWYHKQKGSPTPIRPQPQEIIVQH
jgi:hypothetical protein